MLQSWQSLIVFLARMQCLLCKVLCFIAGSDVDVEQATSQPISFRQPRKRSSSQSLREIHVESTFPTQRDHRQGSWFFCGCKLRPRLHKSSFLLRAFALLVGTFIVFHAASCGYFFCMSFPGPHMLGFSRDLYIDMQSLANLGGKSLNTDNIYFCSASILILNRLLQV